jgi:AraC-like DNA-binding protein
LGSYTNETEVGIRSIGSPAAIFYRAGTAHANKIGLDGFEQIEIEFDPRWLPAKLPDVPVTHHSSCESVRAMSSLAAAWEDTVDEASLKVLTAAIIVQIGRCAPERQPPWIAQIQGALRKNPTASIASLAASIARTPAWVGAEYARWTGETIRGTSARLRVAKAAVMLRETVEPTASIAAETGFCDQSHMTKTFRRILRRTPDQVRAQRLLLRPGCNGQVQDS